MSRLNCCKQKIYLRSSCQTILIFQRYPCAHKLVRDLSVHSLSLLIWRITLSTQFQPAHCHPREFTSPWEWRKRKKRASNFPLRKWPRSHVCYFCSHSYGQSSVTRSLLVKSGCQGARPALWGWVEVAMHTRANIKWKKLLTEGHTMTPFTGTAHNWWIPRDRK